jgi:hypothetical protein
MEYSAKAHEYAQAAHRESAPAKSAK